MDTLETWFSGLHIFFRLGAAFLALPIVFTIVGLMIFMQEPPGDSPWGKKVPWWQQVFGTTVVGFYGSLLLVAIFGLTWLFNAVFGFFHAGSWSGTVAFLLGLFSVLGAVYWWFDSRLISQAVKETEGRKDGV